MTTQVIPTLTLGLIFATFLVYGPVIYKTKPRPARRRWLDLAKAFACWAAALAWALLAARRVPDNDRGVAILVVPLLIGLGGGAFYLARAAAGSLSGFLHSTLSARPLPVSADIDQAAAHLAVRELEVPERVEYAVAYRSLLLRNGLVVAIASAVCWSLAQNSVVLAAAFACLALIMLTFALRIVIGRGPGMALEPSGMSMRPGLAAVRHLPWSEVDCLSLMTKGRYPILVVGVANPERYLQNRRAYRRWVMNSHLQAFGSPIIVSLSALKCDPRQLLATARAFSACYGHE